MRTGVLDNHHHECAEHQVRDDREHAEHDADDAAHLAARRLPVLAERPDELRCQNDGRDAKSDAEDDRSRQNDGRDAAHERRNRLSAARRAGSRGRNGRLRRRVPAARRHRRRLTGRRRHRLHEGNRSRCGRRRGRGRRLRRRRGCFGFRGFRRTHGLRRFRGFHGFCRFHRTYGLHGLCRLYRLTRIVRRHIGIVTHGMLLFHRFSCCHQHTIRFRFIPDQAQERPPPPLFPSFISDYFTYFIAHIFLHNFM